MCGIVGYIGKKQALPILLDGIKNLEYRGYDSAGLAIMLSPSCKLSADQKVYFERAVGKVSNLEKKVRHLRALGTLGIVHCLHPKTLVQRSDGRVTYISNLQNGDEIINLNTTDHTLSVGKVKIAVHQAPSVLYEVRTAVARFLATAEHQTLIYENGQIISKRVDELSNGDLLPLPRVILPIVTAPINFKTINVKRYYSLTPIGYEYLRKKIVAAGVNTMASKSGVSVPYIRHITANDRNFREDRLQQLYKYFDYSFEDAQTSHITPTHSIHGKFLMLPAESNTATMQILGYLTGDGYVGKRAVRFKDCDFNTLQLYKNLIVQEFNVDCHIVTMNDTIAWLLESNSFYLCEWLKENILERHTEFIESLGQLPNEQLAAFIRGLFDAEGYIAKKACQLGIGMNDEFLMRSLQFWLLRFGIIASLHIEKPNLKYNRPSISYRLLISNKDSLEKFSQCIGFGGERKQKQIKELLINIGKRQVSFKFLDGRDDIVISKVTKIQQVMSDVTHVYDLEIEHNQNFIANCVFTHNSRWSTHGAPTEANAHPHRDCKKEIYLVHNGIIENHAQLRAELIERGHIFTSDTDTEVLVHLIEAEERGIKSGHKIEKAVKSALQKIKGTYGLAIFDIKEPEKLIAARNFSPLLIGIRRGEYIVASDASAVLHHTRKVIYLRDGEIATLTPKGYKIAGLTKRSKKHTPQILEWDKTKIQKGGFPHFMLKEINEQPEAIADSIRGRIDMKNNTPVLGGLSGVKKELQNTKRFIISGMGTAYYAGLIVKNYIEEIAKIPVITEPASEFHYRKQIFEKGDAFLCFSQSGETADTLAALRKAKEHKILTLGIVNVVGSSMARETDAGVYQHIGPEVGVASTKAFTSQVVIGALIAILLGRENKTLTPREAKYILNEIKKLPLKIGQILKEADKIKQITLNFQKYENFLFLGRKYNLPTALEGALKLKEISYVHAEGMSAGEMKHGPIAMIDLNFPSVIIVPKDSVYEKNISNMEEIKARGGPIIAVASEGDTSINKIANDVIYIPKSNEIFTPVLVSVTLQLFAYYFAVARNLDIDKPRNLAKSVTVE